MRIGSLCSGYGGLEEGVQLALGGELAWVSDIDKGACRILAHRFPRVPNLGDMTLVDWAQVEPVDLICGGTPCQDLSKAGKRAGMTEGTRSNLWVAMREAIAVLRPSWVVWENVRGALSAQADSNLESREGLLGDRPGRPNLRALGRVLGDLASLRYDTGWHSLAASDIGAPHERFRVFLIATNTDHARWGEPRWPLPAQQEEPRTECPRQPALRRFPTPDTSVGKYRLNGDSQQSKRNLEALARRGELKVSRLLPTPTSDEANNITRDSGDFASLTRTAQQDLLLPTPNGFHLANTETPDGWLERRAEVQERTGTRHGMALPVVLTSVTEGSPLVQAGEGPTRVEATGDRWGPYAAAVHRWEAVLGRPAPEPTEVRFKGRPQLSARFVEWMMGLPAGWVTEVPRLPRNDALRALGNGVVPQQAAAALTVMTSWVQENESAENCFR